MDLPVMPPVEPMLAKAMTWDQLEQATHGEQFVFEPKWDGFRCIVFRDGGEVELQSRNCRSLTRYFPEVVSAIRDHVAERCVIDGEIVVAGQDGLDFDALSERIHPARSRVEMLARTCPGSFVCFDVLALGDTDVTGRPFADRRRALEEVAGGRAESVKVTPTTNDPAVARDWFVRFEGAGLDGVVAKAATLKYLPSKRAMIKVKHRRSGDFVVGGFRWYRADTSMVGSLMLGLYDGDNLRPVGVIGSFPVTQRRSLVAFLAPYTNPGRHQWVLGGSDDRSVSEGGQGGSSRPAAPASRWNAGKDTSFEALRPDLVVEAEFEQLQGGRLRHTARFLRWRPDRDPTSATFDQLDVAVPSVLSDVFSAGA